MTSAAGRDTATTFDREDPTMSSQTPSTPAPSTDPARVIVDVDAPADRVWALLRDARAWPRWGPFRLDPSAEAGSPAPVRTQGRGRRQLRLELAADGTRSLGYRLTGTRDGGRSVQVSVVPLPDGGTRVLWRTPAGGSRRLGVGRLRVRRQQRDMAQLAGRFASYADDLPTTRADWAARTGRHPSARYRTAA